MPGAPKTERITLRLEPEMIEAAEALCKRSGLSMAAAFRGLLPNAEFIHAFCRLLDSQPNIPVKPFTQRAWLDLINATHKQNADKQPSGQKVDKQSGENINKLFDNMKRDLASVQKTHKEIRGKMADSSLLLTYLLFEIQASDREATEKSAPVGNE